MKIIDLSHEIYDGMPTFPLDPPTEVLVHHTIASMKYNITRLVMSTHLGTHLDAPYHFFDAGRTVDKLDLSKCVGPARIINLTNKGPNSEITVADLKRHETYFEPHARIILNVGWYKQFPDDRFFNEMPGITMDCAKWIAGKRIAMLGLDIPGVHPRHWEEVHQILLKAEIVIVEALNNLDDISSDAFFFVALPLKIRGRDGSPVRAIAIEDLW